MLRGFCVLLLCCGVLAACNRSDDSGSKSAADWAKVGETDGYGLLCRSRQHQESG
jgi:hypothetical protein